MKRFVFVAVMALTLMFSGMAQTTSHRSLLWSALSKYRMVDSVKQVILVQYTGGTSAHVKMFVKSWTNGKPVWDEVVSCPANVGKNGIGKEREGDMRTPVGDFGMLQAFGIKPNPGTELPYVDVVESTYCCGDTKAYNRIIDLRDVPHSCEGEHMIEYTPAYNYGFFFDYNKECVFGKGSALFFHCTDVKPYTAGCVAVPEKDMVTILRAIDKNARLIIDSAS